MANRFTQLQGIVFDLAGTTVDHGSCAPAGVFQAVFESHGVSITAAQAREPMGKAKRDHIWSIMQMPPVTAQWQSAHNRAPDEADIDAIYADFLPMQKKVLAKYNYVIDGVAETSKQCSQMGLRIGATTGYTRDLLDEVLAAAREQGFQPEFALGAEDAPVGRPAPFMLFQLATMMQIYPMWRIVKVDDTAVGVAAGRNAGCWTVGVTRTGNGVGLSKEELDALPASERESKIADAGKTLLNAGAHALVESVADIIPVLQQFDAHLESGEFPAQQ